MAISTRLSRKEGRKFAFTLGPAFLIFAMIGGLREHLATAVIFGSASVISFAAGTLVPTRLGPIQRAWMRLGETIARVTTPFTMAAVYFLVITPIGALMRAIGKNPLYMRESADTLWVSRSNRRQSDLERQF